MGEEYTGGVEMKIEERIDNWASDILDTLAEILPPIEDDGILGEQVLERALEMYQLMKSVEENKS